MLLHTNRNIELTGNIKFNIIIVEAEEVFMSFRESKKFKYVAICKGTYTLNFPIRTQLMPS